MIKRQYMHRLPHHDGFLHAERRWGNKREAERFVKAAGQGEVETIRYASVPLAGAMQATLAGVDAYLPQNYTAVQVGDHTIVVLGFDDHGWTLESYVIPRLASALIPCREGARKENVDIAHQILLAMAREKVAR